MNIILFSALSTPKIIGIVVAVVVVLLIVGIVGWIVSAHNSFVRMETDVEESFSTMDVYLKKRWDLIPNLVETVKGYAKHESSTLEAVIAARNSAMGASGASDKIAAENMLSGTLKSLFALSESYPSLKADSQFLNLQNQLQKVEEDIAQSRKYYNAKVKMFNAKIRMFPSNIVASVMKLSKKPFFEVPNEEERNNVKVSF